MLGADRVLRTREHISRASQDELPDRVMIGPICRVGDYHTAVLIEDYTSKGGPIIVKRLSGFPERRKMEEVAHVFRGALVERIGQDNVIDGNRRDIHAVGARARDPSGVLKMVVWL